MKNRPHDKKDTIKKESDKPVSEDEGEDLLEGEAHDTEFPVEKEIETPESHFPKTENDKPEDAHTLTGDDDLPPEDNEDTFSKDERR